MKLKDFAYNGVNTISAFNDLVMRSHTFIPRNIILVDAPEPTEEETDNLRNQLLRYYNSNYDLLAIAMDNYDIWIMPYYKNHIGYNVIAKELADEKGSLTQLTGEADVTIMENYLFRIWPVMHALSNVIDNRVKPQRMINTDLDELTILKLIETCVNIRKRSNPLYTQESGYYYQACIPC